MAEILIIDDDKAMQHLLKRVTEKQGHVIHCASTLKEGMKLASSCLPDLIFLDVLLPDGSGLDNIVHLKNLSSLPEIIIITAYANSDGAALALQYGAWDYLQKNTPIADLRLLLQRALESRSKKTIHSKSSCESILGESWLMKQALELASLYSKNDSNVLITGETGTGKEVFARYIHDNSSRNNKPFVVVDCANLPEELASSILFGHAKGAFTSAVNKTMGLIAEANGGTLFLDELGELSFALQKIFLRVLQEKTFNRVGSTEVENLNIRIIAATNKNIVDMVQQKTFRSDLFYRIQTSLLTLPPLRNRGKDIALLAHSFHKGFCLKNSEEEKVFSKEFTEILENYIWPGNVRELKNTIELANSLAEGLPCLYPQHLPPSLRLHHMQNTFTFEKASNENILPDEFSIDWENAPTFFEYKEKCNDFIEKVYFSELMKSGLKDIEEARNISGLSRSRLYALLKKYNIKTK